MGIRKIIVTLALLLTAAPALAQVTNPWPRMIPVRPDGSVIDPGSVGGGGGGTVTQGSAATDTAGNRWPVLSYQGGAWTFGLSGPIPAGTNAIGSVLADLRVAGAAVSSGNPVPVSVGNFPATQAVSQSGTWSFGLTGPIPAGSNVIGAVTQSGGPWSVSGTVNAAQSGTWNVGLNAGSNNIGTIGNAFVLDATVTARLGTLGQKAMAGSAPVTIASDQPSLPAKIDQTTQGTTNGVFVNNRTLWFAPTLMTASAAAGSTTYSTERDQGATAPSPYSFYRIAMTCDAAGTLRILGKTTPGSGVIAIAATAQTTANTPITLQFPALFRVFQAQYINNGTTGSNGTAATNCTLVDAFTAN